MKIDKFEGDYAFLSNFYPVEVRYKGILFPSSENAYQAAKLGLGDLEGWKQFENISASQSKKLGKKLKIREDWESVKLGIMEEILAIKFSKPILKQLLLGTGDAELIEGNWWHDTYWGVGKNHLGILLMNLRNKIRLEEKLS